MDFPEVVTSSIITTRPAAAEDLVFRLYGEAGAIESVDRGGSMFLMLLAVFPSIYLIRYVYRMDGVEKEPVGLLAKVFFAGVLSAVPASTQYRQRCS